MEHKIVKNERPVMTLLFPWQGGGMEATGRTFRIRQCAYCGCSENFIRHFSVTECRHQPTDEGREE